MIVPAGEHLERRRKGDHQAIDIHSEERKREGANKMMEQRERMFLALHNTLISFILLCVFSLFTL